MKYRIAAVFLLMFQAILIAWAGYRDSPCWDEVGHFAAGLVSCCSGTFSLYRVNPPLVRLVACAPVLLANPNVPRPWFDGFRSLHTRMEFAFGAAIADANGSRYFWLMTLARWSTLPFSLLGGWICYLWARDLYGPASGVLAVGLWSLSPNLIAYGHLITPDMGATAIGVAAGYTFWRWLKSPTWMRTLVAALVLGLAQATKTTWLVLYALWPGIWIIWNLGSARRGEARQWGRGALQGAVMVLISIWIINLAYGFEGSFQKLGDFSFSSTELAGPPAATAASARGDNRFSGTWLAQIPVPLPRDYFQGLDAQRAEFETGMWSYLNGEWRHGGWWYYYLYALLIKVPLGTWAMLILAAGATVCSGGYRAPLRDELVLLAPAAVVLALVSSQTGFNHHVRYVLPIFPFVFIWISKLARSIELGHMRLAAVGGGALAWSIGSSLWIYPHSLSYFNESVGGPKGGHYHLTNSNSDWGQDLLYLRRWLDKHPEAAPLHLGYDLPLIDPKYAGIQSLPLPVGPQSTRAAEFGPNDLGPLPGWYAVSVNKLHNRERDYDYFLDFRPVGYAGYSMYIYHITPEQADAARTKYGMPKLSAGPAPSTQAHRAN
ncbi:MAG TPA: glycosyltransferase family 39 protein [Tepidisphaeraceae bacterium]|nr:glycosyltransferase family 39 protein [Tepidisphaeraceae bacterium]